MEIKKQDLYAVLAELYKDAEDIERMIATDKNGSVFTFNWKDGGYRQLTIGSAMVDEFNKMKLETAKKVAKMIRKRIKQLETQLKITG